MGNRLGFSLQPEEEAKEDTKLLRHYGAKIVLGIKADRTIRRKDDKLETKIAVICRHSERIAKESSLLQYKAVAKNENNSTETDQASMSLGIFASKLVSLKTNIGGISIPPYLALYEPNKV